MLASIPGIVVTKRCTLQSWAWCNGDTEPRTLLRCLQGISPSLTGVPRTKGWQRVLNIKMVDFPWHIWVVENIQTLLIFVPIPDAFIISDSPYDITYPFKPKAIHTPKMGTKLYETNHISIGTITPPLTNLGEAGPRLCVDASSHLGSLKMGVPGNGTPPGPFWKNCLYK